MKEHLGWIILLDALPDGSDFRYRMIGTRVTQYVLADATGKTIAEAVAPREAAEAMLEFHRTVAAAKVPVRAYGAADWLGRTFFEFDGIFLPLSDDGVRVNMILSALTFAVSNSAQPRSAPQA